MNGHFMSKGSEVLPVKKFFVLQVIERYVSPQMARKYLKFDLDCFVETNKSIKWCPYPACQRAVNLPESERQLWEDSSLVPPVSHAVDCGGGHFFCWDCGSPEAHAPLSCGLWQKWLARCAEVAPATGRDASGEIFQRLYKKKIIRIIYIFVKSNMQENE